MRAIKNNTEERTGVGKLITTSLYASLLALVTLIVLCAIFSLISLKSMLNPGIEQIICYILYILAGIVCGFISASQVNRLGIVASIVSGVIMTLILYIGGFLLDGHSKAFIDMLKMMGIMVGSTSVGGIVRMFTKR